MWGNFLSNQTSKPEILDSFRLRLRPQFWEMAVLGKFLRLKISSECQSDHLNISRLGKCCNRFERVWARCRWKFFWEIIYINSNLHNPLLNNDYSNIQKEKCSGCWPLVERQHLTPKGPTFKSCHLQFFKHMHSIKNEV